MTNSTGYIISLKFAPGLKKEFSLIGEALRSTGINIKYLLSQEYKLLENNLDSMVFLNKSSGLKEILLETAKFRLKRKVDTLFSKENMQFIFFYNNHILNKHLARHFKTKYNQAKTLLYFHDPYKPDKRSYGLGKALYISSAEFLARHSLKYIDHVVLASDYAYTLFSGHYQNFHGQIHLAPLLVPDAAPHDPGNRKYFSIIGGYHNATGHEIFIDLVNLVAATGGNYEFALVSSSDISNLVGQLSDEGKKILKIVNRKIIDDSEINHIIANSYAVFRLDSEVTQSGVIPVCYMNATPIIARDIPGLAQHVQPGRTGYVVPFQCANSELIAAMDKVKDNFGQLSVSARQSYEETWAEYNFSKYYSWLIDSLND